MREDFPGGKTVTRAGIRHARHARHACHACRARRAAAERPERLYLCKRHGLAWPQGAALYRCAGARPPARRLMGRRARAVTHRSAGENSGKR